LTVTPVLSINGPASLPGGTVGVSYPSTTVTATGGSAPIAWTAASLPTGLSINASTGAITGTPTSATGSPFSVTVTATDSTSVTATKTYSLSITAVLAINGPASMPAG